MRHLDAYTVILMYVMITLVCSIMVYTMWRRYGKIFDGLQYLFHSYIIQAVGLLIGIMALDSHTIIQHVIPNFLILISLLFFLKGILDFAGYYLDLKWTIPYFAIFLVIFTYFDRIHYDLNVLIAWSSISIIPIYAYLIYILKTKTDHNHQFFTVGIRLVSQLFIIAHLLRVVFTIFNPEILDYFEGEASFDYFMIGIFQALMLLMTFSIMFMMVEKKSFEKHSEAKLLEEVILKKEYLASTDPLTQLFNRRKIETLINDHYMRYKEFHTPFSVLMIDIDHFKAVNDRFGHDVGDQVLRIFSDYLKDNVRDMDSVGRWGGEEFLVILGGVGREIAVKTAERLRQNCSNLNLEVINNNPFTISIGVIEISEDITAGQLIKEADRMLYHAKLDGRNKTCCDHLDLPIST